MPPRVATAATAAGRSRPSAKPAKRPVETPSAPKTDYAPPTRQDLASEINTANQTLSALVKARPSSSAPPETVATVQRCRTNLAALRALVPGDVDVERSAVSVLGKAVSLQLVRLLTSVLLSLKPRSFISRSTSRQTSGRPSLRFIIHSRPFSHHHRHLHTSGNPPQRHHHSHTLRHSQVFHYRRLSIPHPTEYLRPSSHITSYTRSQRRLEYWMHNP